MTKPVMSAILPTNLFVLTQNWSLSWSKLTLWKLGLMGCIVDSLPTLILSSKGFYLHVFFFLGGGSFHAFQSGVPVQLIKSLGDWKSDAVFMYLTGPLKVRLENIKLISSYFHSDTLIIFYFGFGASVCGTFL